jgi:uncharacterized membrane protein YkoI
MAQAFHTTPYGALSLVATLALGAMVIQPVAASSEGLDDCLERVSEIKHVRSFTKVEYLSVSHDGDPSFEIEAPDGDGVEWEFMCDASDGDIYEIEQEVGSASDPLFKQQAKVNNQQVRRTVTALYPGTVKETEYEIESNGDPTYEIDVVDDHGTEWKIEVDAASGDIIEVHVEEWEIGEEPDEMAQK